MIGSFVAIFIVLVAVYVIWKKKNK